MIPMCTAATPRGAPACRAPDVALTCLASAGVGAHSSSGQSASIRTYCKPIEIDYGYNFEQLNQAISFRSGADPIVVSHTGEYHLFVTVSGWYWHPKDLLHRRFVTPSRWPFEDNVAPAALSERLRRPDILQHSVRRLPALPAHRKVDRPQPSLHRLDAALQPKRVSASSARGAVGYNIWWDIRPDKQYQTYQSSPIRRRSWSSEGSLQGRSDTSRSRRSAWSACRR
jgi:hypothetical protein